MGVTRVLTRAAERPSRPGESVTTVELFFDLVFVFTVTQVTALVAHRPDATGVGQALLILAMLWWMYDGYAWLTNGVRPESTAARLLLFGAMATYLVLALCVPQAFGDDGLPFAVAYLVVVAVHAGLFIAAGVPQVVRAILRIAPFNVGGGLLLLAAGFVTGTADWLLWSAAVLVNLSAPLIRRNRGFLVQPAHFVERHGLLTIIALGESVVAVGIGAADLPVTPKLVMAILLGLAVAVGLWWCYFGGDDERATDALLAVDEDRRADLALWVFGGFHYLMIFGVVLLAAGMKGAVGHLDEALHGATPWLLGAGVALFLAAHALYRGLLRFGPVTVRLAAAGICLASAVIGTSTTAAAQLCVLVAALAAIPITDRRAGTGTVRDTAG